MLQCSKMHFTLVDVMSRCKIANPELELIISVSIGCMLQNCVEVYLL